MIQMTFTNNGKYLYNGSFGTKSISPYTYWSATPKNIIIKNNNTQAQDILLCGDNTNHAPIATALIQNIFNTSAPEAYSASSTLVGACFTKDTSPFTADSYSFTRSDGALSASSNPTTGEYVFTLTNTTVNDITVTGMVMWLHVEGDVATGGSSKRAWAQGDYALLAYYNFESAITLPPNQVYVATIGW